MSLRISRGDYTEVRSKQSFNNCSQFRMSRTRYNEVLQKRALSYIILASTGFATL